MSLAALTVGSALAAIAGIGAALAMIVAALHVGGFRESPTLRRIERRWPWVFDVVPLTTPTRFRREAYSLPKWAVSLLHLVRRVGAVFLVLVMLVVIVIIVLQVIGEAVR